MRLRPLISGVICFMRDYKLSGVYKITNKVNGKFYVGSGKSVFNRWLNHASYLSRDVHTGYKLQRAFNKYGFEAFSFEILELHDVVNLHKREQYYLDTLCKAQEYINGTSNYFNLETYNVKPTVHGIVGLERADEIIVRGLRTRGFEKIYKISDKGEFIKYYEMQKQASEENGLSRSTVSKSIKNKKCPKGKDYYFCYESDYDPTYIPVPCEAYNKGIKGAVEAINIKPVYCYDVYGRYYKKFRSGLEAAKYFNVDASGISRMMDNPKKKTLHRTGVHLYNIFSSERNLENKLDLFNIPNDGDIDVYTLFHEFLGSFDRATISNILKSKENVVQQSITKGKVLKGYYFSIF